ncbi:tyrosyl-DNA phosphodiesterase-domain-containing protein [Aspergillus nidulans var. acristatus]
MDSEDEDLRAAIAASLVDAPPPEKAINHETSVVDLTADSDDDVIPIFPKSNSVVGSDTSRDASIPENAEDDEDLKLAIALSLQGPVGQGDSSTSEPNSIPPPERKEKERTEPKATGHTFLGLDRKKMEEERLARLAKRKAQSPAAEQHELKQPRTRSQPDASSVRADTAMQLVAPTSVPGIQFSVGTVKKTFASGHRRLGDDIKIEEVLQSSDLELGVLSSFMWDIDWLFSKVNMEKSRLLLIMQAKDEATKRQYESETASIKSLRLCFPPMEGQINCMHSKLMLLFHPTYLRIAVPTANLTPFDWGEDGVMENSVFLIDLPKKDGWTSGYSTSFYKDLVYFLKASTLHENIIRKLEDFDFSKTSQFAFVHTIGGSHWGDSWQQTGYCGLGRSLSSLGLQANKPMNLDFVTSSLGSITPDFMRCIYLAAQGDSGLTELSFRTAKTFPAKSLADPRRLLPASIADEWKERVRVYFPSEKTVLQSRGGPNSAGTICFQERWFENGKFPKNVLRDCVSVREGLVMHNKILYVQPDEPICLPGNQQCLGWAYVGSANLSESAWGRLVYDRTRKQPKLNCRNWECGVVIPVVEGKNNNDIDASTGNTEETKSQAGGQPGMSRGAQGMGKEENGCLLDIFRGTVPVPMHLPGQRYEGQRARQPWYYSKYITSD